MYNRIESMQDTIYIHITRIALAAAVMIHVHVHVLGITLWSATLLVQWKVT